MLTRVGETEEGEDAEKHEGNWGGATETDWAEAAAVTAAQLPTSSGAVAGEEGQGWNWPWGTAMHGGFLDADALLDDDSEGKLLAHWMLMCCWTITHKQRCLQCLLITSVKQA